jgi:hypothetical protein
VNAGAEADAVQIAVARADGLLDVMTHPRHEVFIPRASRRQAREMRRQQSMDIGIAGGNRTAQF